MLLHFQRLEQLNQTFVAEVPVNFHGWVQKPKTLPSEPKNKHGKPKKYPRVARHRPSSEVRNLLTYSPVFQEQSWQESNPNEQQGPHSTREF